ncbi:MAG: ABC transporter permease, partial [Tannerellaceae bacterium]
ISMMRSLLDYTNEVSALELKLTSPAYIERVKKELQSRLGENYLVKDRHEQQEASFKMMQVEKWMTFLILTFILMIALFNVVSSLSMLILEKKDDVRTLRFMGADDKLISRIFLIEGWMIAGLGALFGVAIGVVLCLLQEHFGFISMGDSSGTFIIDAYPVELEWGDIAFVLATVSSIGFLAAYYPVYYLGKKWLQ